MKIPLKIWLPLLLISLAGAGLMVALLLRQGVKDIASALAAADWGVAAVVVFHLVPLVCDVMAWRALLEPQHRPSFITLFKLRWIGDSVSAMLPVAQVGGEVVRVRLAVAAGMPLPLAAASVLVVMTVGVATQIVFTLSGLALLIALSHRGASLTWPVLGGSLIGLAAIAGFYAVQRVGIFRIIGALISWIIRSPNWRGLAEKGEALDHDVRKLYGRRKAMAACFLWSMGDWVTGAIEVWIALWALGVHTGFGQAYVLESMSQGIRSIIFVVPGALGVQEGGFLLVGSAFGIAGPTLLALALIRRVRELAFGLPGLGAWQWTEGRRIWGRRRDSGGSSPSPLSGASPAPRAASAGADPE